MTLRTTSACGMPEYHNDGLVPPKHGVLSPFAIFAWCAVIAVVLGFASLFVIKFDLERFRGSAHFLEKARKAIAQKDWAGAVSGIQHIQGRDREEPEFLRVVADYLEATRLEPAELHTILDKLEAKGRMLPVDYIWACRLHLAAGKIDAARRALEKVPAEDRSSADALKLSITILNAEGHPKEANAEGARLFRLFPGDPEVVFRTAIRDLSGTFPEIQEAALRRLWDLARQPNEWGQNAVRVLSQQKNLTVAEASRLLDLANKQPGISPTDRLGVVTILLQLDPSHRDDLINAEVSRYQKGTKLEKAHLGRWLATEKEYDKLMSLVPEEELMKSPELFPMVAQGLAAQQRWSELMSLISKDKRLPVSNALAETWRALAAKNLKPDDFREPRAHLELALREAKTGREPFVLSLVGQMGNDGNMPDIALQAYQALADPAYGQEFEMLVKCWDMAMQMKDSEELMKIAVRMAELRPENHGYAWRRDYLRLLRGERVEVTLEEGQAGRSEDEKNDVLQLMRALKAYRMHDMAQVSEHLGKIHSPESFTKGEGAVCAGLLAANGDQARAYAIAEKIHPDVLLKEEEVLWRKAL
ncbi:hypothetical protein [Prosthecobacter sp.]|uniref:hypothetical protein n=1 Tax=Prosthecobacter sp. TaxID=1965333 RepID=UPI003783ECEE